jgi:uncharacterized protein (DUF427 family)
VSLTAGRGPLSRNPVGRFDVELPGEVTYVEPFQRRVTATIGTITVVDSERVALVHRPGRSPEYAFPAGDVTGVAAFAEPELVGYVAVAWDAVDAWYEEGNRVFGHPRNPYHRIDCLRSSRRLSVEHDGVVIVDTTRTTVLYETGIPPRLYVSPTELRVALVPSNTTTYCPYKGTASYWDFVFDGGRVADIAWSYEDPLAESIEIAGYLSFYETRVTLRHDLPAPAF